MTPDREALLERVDHIEGSDDMQDVWMLIHDLATALREEMGKVEMVKQKLYKAHQVPIWFAMLSEVERERDQAVANLRRAVEATRDQVVSEMILGMRVAHIEPDVVSISRKIGEGTDIDAILAAIEGEGR